MPVKNNRLTALKISTSLKNKIKKALEILNENESEVEISTAEFRRMALKHFANKVLKEGLILNFKKN